MLPFFYILDFLNLCYYNKYMKNFWLMKKKEKLMLRVVIWAQKNNKRVEYLSLEDMILALKEEK